ncbi:hypothetical protein C8J57DRAFT_709113 [Mycena rebaudengoi]|nr:hypothetical protein C8J57DRAFT_709113 [Mycena rebaudengoi]
MSFTMESITNYFKPHRGEALLRIRSNAFIFLLIAVLSSLIPRIPALPTALAVVLSARRHTWWTADWLYASFCMLVGAVALLSLNILQGIYAVNYPRAPLPPSPLPAKGKSIHMAPPTPQRSFKLSPNSSPQPQKSFSFPSPASASYPSSPLSTPSRVMHYSIPANPSSSTSSTSTFASTLHTPSPIISAYHGKHQSGFTARPVDGAFLAGLLADESDED